MFDLKSIAKSGGSVQDSEDLQRILRLPRRPQPSLEALQVVADALKAQLGKPRLACACKRRWNARCADTLRPVQAWALSEAEQMEGLFAPIGVGHGKTLLDLLTPLVMRSKRAVLLLPSSLKRQILDKDWHYYGEHWRLPNLSTGKWFDPNLPTLYVVGYEELSGSKQTDLLERLKPDLVIADEAHSVSRRTAARTKRFLRHFTQNPGTRLCCWSGTLTKRALTDYAHLADLALHDGSPVPRWWPTVEEWNSHLDPIKFSLEEGALRALALPGETAKQGLRRWTVETKGVVSSADDVSCEASLVITPVKLDVPPAVSKAIQAVAGSWDRPDGEALVDPLSVMRCLRELSCGFFYRWRWPRGEPQQVIDRWLQVRKDWHRELRERLKRGGTHMDSPLLLTKAAIRWQNGYVHITRDEHGNETRREVPPHTKAGPLPTWDSEFWPAWEHVRNTAQPETEAVWLDDFMVDRCVRWLAEAPGIVWFEFGALEARLHSAGAGLVLGAGDDASRRVLALRGDERVCLGIRSHGTGKNLQAFSRNLVAVPPADGAAWEQLLGRTHRQGQEADEVTVDVFTHGAFQQALDKAKTLAYYIESTFGAPQRLTKATWRDA